MPTRREFVVGSAALRTALLGRNRLPNFLILLTDDHGYHDLGCQGAGDLKTPNLDALAASGARFVNWYSNAPMCAPARAALLTGRYPIRAGVPQNGLPLPPSELTIARLLKALGYSTGLVGKWHLGSTPESLPNAHGFDFFFGFLSGCIDYYSHRFYWGEPRVVNYHDLWRNRTEVFEDGQYFTELVTREALAFIERNWRRPFFLYVAYNAPHYPMHAPARYVSRFPELEWERRMYAAMVAAVDDSVGAILSLIEKLGLRDNTLIFFSSDNGATAEPRAGLNQKPARGGSNHPFRGWKFSLFDGGIHVPAILSWPGTVPSGQVVRELASHVDLLPTVLMAAGAPLPPDRTIDGRNILPVVTQGAPSPHEALFWSSGGQLAVRRGRWKLVKDGFEADGTPEGQRKLEGEDALFLADLEEDPGERRNLRRNRPDLVDELLTLAEKWLRDIKRS
jgi:arylsulfatase A-like enzyme